MAGAGNSARFLAWIRGADAAPAAIEAGSEDAHQLVEDAFTFAEERHDRAVSAQAAATMACRAGCSWCCHLPVITTVLEVAHAWAFARRTLPGHILADIAERAEEYDAQAGPQPCPFLLDDERSVHPARPLACRAWNSTRASACEQVYEGGAEAGVIPVLTASRGVYANAAQALAQGIMARAGPVPVTLRDGLSELLADVDG